MDRKPVLLVLSSTYPRWRGDPEPGFVHELAKRLAADFRTIVLCPRAPGAASREVMDGVEIVRYAYGPRRHELLVNDGGMLANLRRKPALLALLPTFFLAQLIAAWRIVRRERVDLVHAHWLVPQGLVAAMLALVSRRPVPYVVTSHGADLFALRGRAMTAIKSFVARRAAAVTVVSDAMLPLASALAGGPAVSVESMGVDLQERFTSDASVTRRPGEILFVGRLVEKKGLRVLLEAMPRVIARIPDATLTIVGFGPAEVDARGRVATLGLSDRVTFAGAVSQSELPAYYRRAAVFAAPFVRASSGDEEGLGLVLAEALGCGCPVVASDLDAIAMYDVPSGALSRVPAGSVGDLADAIVAALVRGGEVDSKCVADFDWSVRAAAYAALLARAMDEDASARQTSRA